MQIKQSALSSRTSSKMCNGKKCCQTGRDTVAICVIRLKKIEKNSDPKISNLLFIILHLIGLSGLVWANFGRITIRPGSIFFNIFKKNHHSLFRFVLFRFGSSYEPFGIRASCFKLKRQQEKKPQTKILHITCYCAT